MVIYLMNDYILFHTHYEIPTLNYPVFQSFQSLKVTF